MKNQILSTAIGLLLSCSIYAQETLSPAMQEIVCSSRLELFGGLNAGKTSKQDLSDSETNTFRPGFNLGVRMHTQLGKGFSFMPGLAYDQKGTNYEYSYDDTEFGPSASYNPKFQGTVVQQQSAQSAEGVTNKVRLNYLTVPLLFGYGPVPNWKAFQVIAGLNPSFLLAHKTKINSFGNESEQTGTDNLRTFDLGLAVGVSYMVLNNFGVMAMYDHGLINIQSAEGANTSFNRTLRFGLFYRLNFNPLIVESYGKQRKNLSFE